jgi:glycosyltransferase involved in cell wall biosynthesis
LGQEELRAFYRKVRILAAPSICWEAFPLALPEAMHYGVPVVCSRIGGLPEIVTDGETGLLCEPGDSASLARKIDFLWRRPDLCDEMGKTGREKTLKEYGPEAYYEKLALVYNAALERPI